MEAVRQHLVILKLLITELFNKKITKVALKFSLFLDSKLVHQLLSVYIKFRDSNRSFNRLLQFPNNRLQLLKFKYNKILPRDNKRELANIFLQDPINTYNMWLNKYLSPIFHNKNKVLKKYWLLNNSNSMFLCKLSNIFKSLCKLYKRSKSLFRFSRFSRFSRYNKCLNLNPRNQ